MTQVRAHSTEVVDIVTLERPGASFVATASRDRTIQLFVFNDMKLELLQTMDEHAADYVNGMTQYVKIVLVCPTTYL